MLSFLIIQFLGKKKREKKTPSEIAAEKQLARLERYTHYTIIKSILVLKNKSGNSKKKRTCLEKSLSFHKMCVLLR